MESFLILMYLWMPFSGFDDIYMSGGTGMYFYSRDDGADYTMLGFQANMGSYFNEYLAGELRFGLASQDENRIDGEPVDIHMKRFVSAYARGIAPINDEFEAYALLGYTQAELDFKSETISSSPLETGPSYGIGASYLVDESTAFDAEYLFFQDRKDGELSSLTVSIRFDI